MVNITGDGREAAQEGSWDHTWILNCMDAEKVMRFCISKSKT